MVYCFLPSAAAPVDSTSPTDVTNRSSLIGTHIVEAGNWKHLEASPSPNCRCSAIKINNTTRRRLSIKIITTLFCSLPVKLFFWFYCTDERRQLSRILPFEMDRDHFMAALLVHSSF